MIWQNIKNWVVKISLYLFTALVGLFLFCFLAVQLPSVQTGISTRVLDYIYKHTGYKGEIERFYLLWYDRLHITNLKLQDPESNEMLRLGTFHLNFNFSDLILRREINLDAAILKSSEVKLYAIHESDSSYNLNLVLFLNRVNEMLAGETEQSSSSKINLGEIILDDINFSLDDNRKEPFTEGFDWNHFSFHIPSAEFQSFRIIGDTIQFDINDFKTQEKNSGLHVKRLHSFFRFSRGGLELLGMELNVGESYVTDTLRLFYEYPAALGNFVEDVELEINLNNAIFHPQDLALFVHQPIPLKDPIQVDGKFTGYVNDFVFSNMTIRTGASILSGELSMFGLPDIDETFIDLKLNKSALQPQDISLFFQPIVAEKIIDLGRVDFNGQFLGFINDFVANGEFSTTYGRIFSDINLKIDQNDINRSSYSGRLRMNNFKLGEYLRDTAQYQLLSLNGRLTGKGFNPEIADVRLDGEISKIGILGYTYTNIKTNARFSSQYFQGFVSIKDPNIDFTAQTLIDTRKTSSSLKVNGVLESINLHTLNLSDKFLYVSSKLDIDITGLHIDSIRGNINLADLHVIYDKQEIFLDSIRVYSGLVNSNRSLNLSSSLFDVSMVGDFTFTNFFKDAAILIDELILQLRNDRQAIKEYYTRKNYNPDDYEVKFEINLHDINPILKLVVNDFEVSKNIVVEGDYYSGINTMLTAYTFIDSIQYTNKLFTQNTIEFNGSKISDSTSVLAMFFINSKEQNITSKLFTRDLSIEGVWSEDFITFMVDLYQKDVNNFINVNGDIQLKKDSTQIRFMPSKFKVLDKTFGIEIGNRIMVSKKEFKISNLNIFNQEESISINGYISEDPEKALLINFNELSVSILNPILDKELGGTMMGHFDLRDVYHNPTIQNKINIFDHTVDGFLIGNITGNNEWNNSTKIFELNFNIERLGKKIIDIDGTYDPFVIGDQLDLTASFADANLKIAEPFLDFFLSQIDGTITGKYTIKGNFDLVKISGNGNIKDGQLKVNYLNTFYKFNGAINMAPDRIILRNIDVTDINGNTGRINGHLSHTNFSNLQIDLDGNFNNFQVLNTTSKDNELFYGLANASGRINFFGPLNNMKITATAKTEKGTRISIPLGGSSETYETKEYIKFVNFTNPEYNRDVEETIKTTTQLTGIVLEFNIEITPDAYCEIIFDIKAGDIIRGRGRGDLKLQLDTKGEFNMFGPIEFTEGAYNFTLYDIINKEFTVLPGGKITWYGDPYQGTMNIKASYNQLASIAPILGQPDCSAPQINRKYPIQVMLDLDGPLLSPLINFDIVAKDLPDVLPLDGDNCTDTRPDFDFQAFKNRIDDQELKRQVFSLIILRRFSPPDAFFSAGGSSIRGSVSELLSNQLSYWMTQVDDKLEIDVDLQSLDTEAYNTFQLRLSYRFLDGRLRVTRDGSIVPQDERSSTASLIGDITVEYMLTPDGKFRAKMYNRTNFNTLQIGQQSTMTTGASIQYTQSFNEIKELIQSSRNRKRREEDNGASDTSSRTNPPANNDGSY